MVSVSFQWGQRLPKTSLTTTPTTNQSPQPTTTTTLTTTTPSSSSSSSKFTSSLDKAPKAIRINEETYKAIKGIFENEVKTKPTVYSLARAIVDDAGIQFLHSLEDDAEIDDHSGTFTNNKKKKQDASLAISLLGMSTLDLNGFNRTQNHTITSPRNRMNTSKSSKTLYRRSFERNMNYLSSGIGSTNTTIMDWNDAQTHLSKVLILPTTQEEKAVVAVVTEDEESSDNVSSKNKSIQHRSPSKLSKHQKSHKRKNTFLTLSTLTKIHKKSTNTTISTTQRRKKFSMKDIFTRLNSRKLFAKRVTMSKRNYAKMLADSARDSGDGYNMSMNQIASMKSLTPVTTSHVEENVVAEDEGRAGGTTDRESVGGYGSSAKDSSTAIIPAKPNNIPTTNSITTTTTTAAEETKSFAERFGSMVQNRIPDAERQSAIKRRQEQIEQQVQQSIAAREAQEAASSLLRDFTDEEAQIVRTAIYSVGPLEEILASSGGDSVQRESMQTLKPGQWLNDEVIHYFYQMLANRDERLSNETPGKKRSHFFKSFFFTKLFDEGGSYQYTYSNVKRWSRRVPGKDIFALDKIFVPANQDHTHWGCAVIHMQEKRIQFYDSMLKNGKEYLRGLFQYIQDEWAAKKDGEFPNKDEWTLVPTSRQTPTQHNGFDCGVFTCMFADFIAMGHELTFQQEHITQCRERIALSIMKGAALE